MKRIDPDDVIDRLFDWFIVLPVGASLLAPVAYLVVTLIKAVASIE